ncbi:MAG: hypothetical protein NTY64_09135 [Deltaproteobacteria bacterium]|nr:hypothetical protein [Deltaproteobacteria bacterium]
MGDTISPRHTVEKIWKEGEKNFVRFRTTITNQRGETVLEGFHLYRVLRPTPGEKA